MKCISAQRDIEADKTKESSQQLSDSLPLLDDVSDAATSSSIMASGGSKPTPHTNPFYINGGLPANVPTVVSRYFVIAHTHNNLKFINCLIWHMLSIALLN